MIVIASIADTADNIVTTFGIDWPMFIAQAVNFTLVAAAIWFFGFKKILSTIKEREKQISDSFFGNRSLVGSCTNFASSKALLLHVQSSDNFIKIPALVKIFGMHNLIS